MDSQESKGVEAAAKLDRATLARGLAAGAALSLPALLGEKAFAATRAEQTDPFVLTSPTTAGENTIQAAADLVDLTLKASAGQTADLQQWQDPSGELLARFTASGRLDFTQTGEGHGPHAISQGGLTYGDFFDPIISFGYNSRADGGPILVGEPINRLQFEGDYWDGIDRTMETFFEYANTSGSITSFRPLFISMRREATTREAFLKAMSFLTPSWQVWNPKDSGDQLSYWFLPENLRLYGQAGLAPYFETLPSEGVGTGGLSLGSDGQRDQFRLEALGPNTASFYVRQGVDKGLFMYKKSSTPAGICMAVGVDETGAALTVLNTTFTGTRVIAARARVGQVGDIIAIEDSGRKLLGRFNKEGYFMTRKTGAPADADLVKSELTVWLDDTPGATRLMINAKDSAGTVRTGSLPLE
jgi:hypothetical protein